MIDKLCAGVICATAALYYGQFMGFLDLFWWIRGTVHALLSLIT